MDKMETVYRGHSAKEHLLLALMIIAAFFILTSRYNPEVLPAFTGTPTGAAAAVMSVGTLAIWGLIMLLLVMGIIVGITLWWRNHRKVQVQKVLQQKVQSIVAAADAKRELKSKAAVDPLARKLNKVQQELVDIPLPSAATKGHVLTSLPAEYREVPSPSRSLRHLLPRKKPKKVRPRLSRHIIKPRPSLDEKMLQIKKEITRIKTRE